MIRSRRRTVALLLALLAAASAWAQGDVLDNPEFVAARQLIEDSHDAVIKDELRLTEEEAALFWPLYAEYRNDTLPIRDRYIALIADYVKQYESGNLTNEYAARMLDGYFAVRGDLLAIRKQYVARFATIMPMLKVARFYQLENKMTADVEAELALLVPLVESE